MYRYSLIDSPYPRQHICTKIKTLYKNFIIPITAVRAKFMLKNSPTFLKFLGTTGQFESLESQLKGAGGVKVFLVLYLSMA